MLLKLQLCLQSAETYILRLILLNIFSTFLGLLADLDLQDLEALIAGPTSALNFFTHLQTVEKTIELLQ